MVHKIRLFIEKITTWLAVFLMLLLVVLSFSQVVLRNFFATGFNAFEELMRNAVLWIAFIGATLTTLRGKHISIDILPRFAKGRFKIILNWALSITASLICFYMSWLGLQFLKLEIDLTSVIAGSIPAWIIEIIIPVGFLLLAITFPLRVLDSQNDEKEQF